MAFSKDQREPSMPVGSNVERTSVDFLPRYFRTSTNQKFLNATVDQMISEGTVDKINAFIGRKNTEAYSVSDRYLEEISNERAAYQLEPALIIRDNLDNVQFFKDYNDYINQIKFFNGSADDHNKLNSQEFYSWDPHIDWDKFVNYREYYWLPKGPLPITVLGQSVDVQSTYKIRLVDDVDNLAYVFSPDDVTRNPTLKLYRGQTYRFEVDCEAQPISFKTSRTSGNDNFYTNGITADSEFVGKGVIEFVVPIDAPEVIYYVGQYDINSSGFFKIFDIEEATAIDVENEILGKKTYTLGDGTALSNGMKLYFQGQVTPEKYASDAWYVEGVGDKITLIAETDLETPAPYTVNENIEFDNEKFDTQGFDVNNNFPSVKDYIVINRASKDRNPWSRYNRWFHREVIETSAAFNNQEIELDQTARAKRPIIEFEPNIKLWQFGTSAKKNVTLVDTFTQDVFSTIEGSLGYNVDGFDLIPGMRVLFTADTDIRVNGRIFRVDTITHLGNERITLVAESDTDPAEDETVLVLDGSINKGKMFYYQDGFWKEGQSKATVNQTPLFDVFDINGVSYGNRDTFLGTTFAGTALFGYKPGTTVDPELGIGITYRNIGNIGDIVFDFNLHKDTFTYQDVVNIVEVKLDNGYLKKTNNGTETFVNGWIKSQFNSKQPVVRQYDVAEQVNFFEIDVYNRSGDLNDLVVTVFVNGVKQTLLDFDIFRQNGIAYVQFFQDRLAGDVVTIETMSATAKNNNGFYKFPSALESNPQNQSLTDLTLGEVIDHAKSIAYNLDTFIGTIPGTGNLRDQGLITSYGTKVVQHSAPLSLVAYHITDKDFNIVKSLRYARDEYAKFKRNLLRVSEGLGYDGLTRIHLDLVLKEATKDLVKEMPFYLSDMIAYGANFVYEQNVIDDSLTDYPLTFDFNLDSASEKAVLIYLNEELLVHGRDYEFINTSFVRILTELARGDNLKIVQYETTDACFVPPTPTKLGLYPAFEPKIYIDDTFQTPTKVIQGHDGSIVVAFNDFRDDLILEFETRIYNNIKVKYNTELFDIKNFIEGYYRKTELQSIELDNLLRQEFLKWSRFITEDYTKHTFFDRNNTFTFNYKQFVDPAGDQLNGFWRGIYKYFYDTDRPHTDPWEMIGYSIKPSWWEQVYGPAPYTRNNLILWEDLRDGVIREPGKIVQRIAKYQRSMLLDHIPVDEFGNLLDPMSLGIVRDYIATAVEGEFAFGDHAPIESAWRRGSEYPFALLISLILTRPAQVFATCFDRIRQVRDTAGQIVYKTDTGNLRLNTENLIYPNTVRESTRSFTSGLINYIVEYAVSKSLDSVDDYKNDLESLQVKIASKLGGFTTKDKFKLVLDSRSPLNKGNVFVPEENYDIFLNTSSPVLSISYSGIIIEKETSGFVVKGYNQTVPEFKYFAPVETFSDPVINVGGISESFVDWDIDKFYPKGKIVRQDQNYFRVTTAHTSGSSFELKYFAKLPALPVTGGREIILRRNFSTEISSLHYGAELRTVQDVVDFILGYGEYLKFQGFDFEYFNPTLQTVTDWQTSAKEFAFWTTQNWSQGSVISLSPSADELIFQKDFSVVDNIYDNFYEYSILKQDGLELEPLFTNSVRKGNSFTLRPKNTADGIYHATLNLVQKEHVLVLDDVTVFNDIIFDQTQGYHQNRIKVLGYRTDGWQGDFNIPGFIYDRAVTSEWTPWKDYPLGETVKYKEFYYSAKKNISGAAEFNVNEWFRLSGKPEAKLLPNWDYRANQFADFYDLDTDSFDVDQQMFAQHLIGYQKRDYLQNIINDDVSQYKFYQGMIREKGTLNSLTKLFDPMGSSDKDSLEFFEEWAIRLGQYGASDGFQEVEYRLDENKFLINPQPFELAQAIDPNVNDFVYRILDAETYLRPENYTHSPFPTTATAEEYVRTAGYVQLEDVDYRILTKNDFSNFTLSNLREGDYFWVGYDKSSWNVYRFSLYQRRIKSASQSGANLRFTLWTNLDPSIQIGEFVGLNNTLSSIEGIHEVQAVGYNYFEITAPTTITAEDIELINFDPAVNVYIFSPQRISSIDNLNSLGLKNRKSGDLVWVDNTDNQWAVWQYQDSYNIKDVISTEDRFGVSVTASDDGTTLAVGADNKVLYYKRPTTTFEWAFSDQIQPISTVDFTDTADSFGESLALSRDGNTLLIGAPRAEKVSGDSAATENEGYVAVYVKDAIGTFIFSRVLLPASPVAGEFFGHKIVLKGNIAFIASKGSAIVPSAITVINITNGNILDRIEYTVAVEVTDIAISDTNVLVVSKSDEEVLVYNFVSNSLELSQELRIGLLPSSTFVSTGSNFGSTVDISRDGKLIAVGLPQYSEEIPNQGAVILYEDTAGVYDAVDLLTAPDIPENEKFGYRVRFNIDGDQLVVYSYGGNQTVNTIFDDGNTSFDLNSTNFIELQEDVGNVRVFEKYGSKFLFATELEIVDTTGINYGDNFVVTDRVYVNDYTSSQGAILEFFSEQKSWSVYRQSAPVVDLKKIKSIFLYDIEDNVLITHLDYIDPIGGKILGIAEQELSYKTYFDPAVYSIGTEDVNIDPLMSWQDKNIGKLWWDLSTVKFINPYQGSTLYKANTWNNLYDGATVDIYEWVESEFSPSVWDSLADTEEGLTLGISGQSKYGDLAFSLKQKYDNVSKTFKNIYYFWVKNKTVVPDHPNRKISASDVSGYISDPKSKGARYVTLMGANEFALVNCKELIADRNVAINFRYWIIDNTELNVHSHYQLLAEGDINKKLNKNIEQKWFDSLVGYDKNGRDVPDLTLPFKLRYGILNKPRQGMFINRLEAVKQFIERINSVLIDKLLIDDFDLSKLDDKDPIPTEESGLFDAVVPTASQIRFVGTASTSTAVLTPVVENGKIIRVIINSPGSGYGRLIPYPRGTTATPTRWFGPTVTIVGSGKNAKLTTVVNSAGQVVSVIVEKTGEGYSSSTTTLSVRPLTALVTNDETASGKWSLYTFNQSFKVWERFKAQLYDVTKYWNYVDWYASGYNEFTKIDYTINFAYELSFNPIQIGEVVKISNQGTGGWILLEKINDQDTTDVTINYKTIGRENGTIQFKSNLYKFENSNIGYDGLTYDNDVFDDEPKDELRLILDIIKNDIFIDELEVEYNKLFFASLRYVFSEQTFVDWAFKTSFVKSRHNLGELEQKPTYQNDNLSSYEEYINEVKPYRSKVREFISGYQRLDETRTAVTDFDLPPRYDSTEGKIKNFNVQIKDSLLDYDSSDILSEPYSDFYYNVGYGVVEINVIDGGSGYQVAPQVEIQGPASTTATATAYLSQGRVSKIVVDNPGVGYLSTPVVVLNGSVSVGGTEARAAAVLGNSLVRTNKVGIKFDRISPEFKITSITITQAFTGTGSTTRFNLKWPVDIRTDKTVVVVSNEEKLSSEFKVYNLEDTSSTYSRHIGVLEFTEAPATGAVINIQYTKNIELLDAADRIQYYYNPKPGMLGKDLGQLMTGVDYGGVEVTGIDFDIGAGWDALPWFTSGWDDFDIDYTDFLVISDGTTRTFTLPYVPADGELINVYLNGVRIDDSGYVIYNLAVNNLTTLEAQLAVLESEQQSLQLIDDANAELVSSTIVTLAQKQDELTDLRAELEGYSSGSPEYVATELEIITLEAEVITLTNDLSTYIADKAQSAADLAAKILEVNVKQAEVTVAQNYLNSLTVPTNETALMDTIVGDGSTQIVSLPAEISLDPEDLIIFRKSTSDGSFRPTINSFDTEIAGGDFSYSSARGINAEEIVIDGDGFVTPYSSHAPEEIVTGQVVDTVDIKVYHKVSDGSPVILTRQYTVSSTETTYSIGQSLGSKDAVFVKINGLIKRDIVDYTVNFIDSTITLTATPTIGDSIVVTSMSKNGLGILDLDNFIGDGSTTEFVTSARWVGDYSAFVTVNGDAVSIETFITDNTYENVGNIGIRFDVAPAVNSIIDYTIINSLVNSISKVQKQTVVYDGSTAIYDLEYDPAFKQPLENNVIVEFDGHILRPADTYYFNVVGSSRTFYVNTGDYANNTIDTTQIRVFKNGQELALSREFAWISATNELRIKRGVASVGDVISMTISSGEQYVIEGDSSNTQIRLLGSYTLGDEITVTTFTNHDILDVQRFNEFIRSDSILTPGTSEYFRINQLKAGRFQLPSPALGAEYVWVILNNELLTPEVDYVLEENKTYIRISETRNLISTDIIDVIIFSSNTIKNPFAYRIFKDMLNRTAYKRIDDSTSTQLLLPLNYFDSSITVVDASGLTEPRRNQNQPGVVFIDNERIEYLRKEGNVLSQLRRGTLGTGVKEQYSVGTTVNDQSAGNTIPYKDETITSISMSDGSSNIIPIDFAPLVDSNTLNSSWFRDTIPSNYGQAKDIEVFVAGRRLRKNPTFVWQESEGPDSPSGDIQVEAEFSVDGVNAVIRLTEDAPIGTTIIVQKRIGQTWVTSGESLVDSNSDQAKFVRAKPANLVK